MTTAPTALTNPTARSISPIRRTKTTPIAIVATAAICRSRFVKFRDVRKFSSRMENVMTIKTRPTMIGSVPSSPARTPATTGACSPRASRTRGARRPAVLRNARDGRGSGV